MPQGKDPFEALLDDTKLDDISPVNVNTDLTFEPVEVQAPLEIAGLDTEALNLKSTEHMDTVSKSLEDLRVKNEDRLAGKLSGDVVAEVRRHAAERATASGVAASGAGSRAIEARDLGMTSMDVQERGFATEQQLNQVTAQLADFENRRAAFSAEFTERSRQFNERLSLDQNNQRLSYKQLQLQRDSFNASQNSQLIGFIANLAASQAGVSANLAMADIDDSNVVAGYQNIMSRIDDMLKIGE